MNAIRTLGVLGICVALAGCAGSHDRTKSAVPGSVTLAEAREGIEEGYRLKRAAYVTKDGRALTALRTEDFQFINPEGKSRDRAATETYMADYFRGINRWLHLDFIIDSLRLDSGGSRLEADAITRQHLVRMEVMSDKRVHHYETWSTLRERWRWTPDGWKSARVDGLGELTDFVDGKLRSIPLAEGRKGIEEGYARNRAAFLAKDVKAVMALRTDDFHTIGPDGTTKDRSAMEMYTVGLLNSIDRWITIEFTIDSLSLDSKKRPLEAEAIMRQHLVRMALRPDNKVHHVETWATQRERWRWTPDGWKLAKVDGVRDMKRLVDGKPE